MYYIEALKEILALPGFGELIVAVVSVIGAFLVAIFTARAQRKSDFTALVGEKVSNALDKCWNISQELGSVTGTLSSNLGGICPKFKQVDPFVLCVPSFMCKLKDYNDFCDRFRDFHEKNIKYLSPQIAVYVREMNTYLILYSRIVEWSGLPTDELMTLLGCWINDDLQNWRKRVEPYLIRQFNSGKARLYLQEGPKWEKLRVQIHKDWYEGTKLHSIENWTVEDIPKLMSQIEENLLQEKQNPLPLQEE